MPSAKKVRWAQLRVGVMAIAAIIILAVLVWLLSSQKPIWQRYATVYTYMEDSAALAKGAPVRLNGIPVGSVRNVDLSGSTDPKRFVRIDMEIRADRLRDIPVDSVAGISAENVLGAKQINISKGRSRQAVRAGGELPSEPSTEIQDLVRKGLGIFDSAQVILTRIDRLVGQIESGRGSVGKFLVDEEFYNRLVATVKEFQEVSHALATDKGTVGKLLHDEGLYNDVRGTVQRFDTLVADLQAGQGSAGKFLRDPSLYDEARATIGEFRRLMDDINAGKGTAGKLLKDEEAYRQIQSVLARLDNTLERINSGQGTIGQLLVNTQLYDSMRGVTDELHALMKDIRANPKKFLRIKLALF